MLRLSAWIALLILLVNGFSQKSIADILLPKIFSDHMVLQQNADVKIWGTAEVGDVLVVTFDKQTIEVAADDKGRWSAQIKTPSAGGPYEITIAVKGGEPKIIVRDVLIGEVWICSGQSNMAWPVKNALNPKVEMQQANSLPKIRFFSVGQLPSPTELTEFDKAKSWDCCSPESVADFSAVGFFFGRELHRELQVPIGLINTSFGGTTAEAWVSRAGLEGEKKLAPMLKQWGENDNPTSKDRPANLFNGMIAPLKGYSFRGVIWYQGESNVGRGSQYATLFPTLIKDWRTQLAGGREFPFYFAQLAPFRYQDHSPEALPEVWDAQLKTLQSMGNVGMAVTTDVGEIADIHPRNKQTVAKRLSLWALARTYADRKKLAATDGADAAESKPIIESGPIYEGMTVADGKIRLAFKYATGGLKSRDGKPLTHFLICGDDMKFVPATVEIVGEELVVSSPDVPAPKNVRFAWDDIAEPNFIGSTDLPASPFRTDDFPLLSVGIDF